MSDLEKVPADSAKADKKPEKKEPWLKKYLPSWWVFQQKPEKIKKPFKQELCEWGGTLLVAMIIAFLCHSFVFQNVRVDGNSIYPTLNNGEFMYVSKLEYGTSFFGIPFTGIGTYFTVGGEPERFDVVVCNYPNRLGKHGERLKFVKRVVGLPGDTVAIRDGFLYVDDVKYDEPFLAEYIAEDFGPYTVPEGHYFVMGDNRDASHDSRNYYSDGTPSAITRNMICGHVRWVAFPFTGIRTIE